MRKFGFLVGFGAGYVLGAKAGNERYEQLRRLYENLVASPTVRQATGRAREAASTGFDQARSRATEGASKVQQAVKEKRASADSRSGLSVAPPPQ